MVKRDNRDRFSCMIAKILMAPYWQFFLMIEISTSLHFVRH